MALAPAGGTLPPYDPPSRLLWATVGAVAGTALASLVYYATKEQLEQVIPLKYQYRPGTISGWLSRVLAGYSKRRRSRRPVRVYMDGCFDMMHYGHANALRQAKALGDQLVVGLIPDSEILRCKGPPVQDEEERLALVDAVKWVDEVIQGVPYDLSPEFISELFTKHKIDYIVHGDDPCLLPDGTDAYAHAKRMGRFRMIKRTEGVSTTDIVGRMLTCTRSNPFVSDLPHPLAAAFSTGDDDEDEDVAQPPTSSASPAASPPRPNATPPGASASTSSGQAGPSSGGAQQDQPGEPPSLARASTSTRTGLSKFLPTSRRLVQFSNGRIAPDGARIVYIDGAFDVFHPGHVKILKLAKAQGDFLLVGLHTDEDVTERRGPHLPIMNLHERSLSVLACKYVDEVIIGSPTQLTDDLIKTFNINVVVRGTVSETGSHTEDGGDAAAAGSVEQHHATSNGSGSGAGGVTSHEEDRYAYVKQAGMFRRLQSPSSHTARNIIHRIVAKRQEFEARNAKKVKSEASYYQQKKEYVAEL